MPTLLPRTPRINELTLDWRALAFVALTSVLGGLRVQPDAGGRRHASQRFPDRRPLEGAVARADTMRVQRALVVGQVALSVVLVGSATLLLRSYYNLTHVDTGLRRLRRS